MMDTLKLSSPFQGPSQLLPASLSFLPYSREISFCSKAAQGCAGVGRQLLATGPGPQLWCFWTDPREGSCDRGSALNVKSYLCVLSPSVVWAQEEVEMEASLGCQ